MIPILATKRFIHSKILEFYEGLQQWNLPAIHCLIVLESALKPKIVTDFIGQAAHYLTFIGVLETSFKHHLMDSNKHSFNFQYDY